MGEMETKLHVAFVGNPNCGKTTLFNGITGSKLKVANWPGVTVEKKEGTITFEDKEIVCIDTPGIYSLTSYSIEEIVTRKCVMDDDIEVIVNVVDASSLERNLYLTLQLLELGKPLVIALNMMDVVEKQGMEIDLHRLPELLGDIPVIPISAAKGMGFNILLHAVLHHYEEGSKTPPFHYSEDIEFKIEQLEVMLKAHDPKHSSLRFHAIKMLEEDEQVMKEHPISIHNIVDKNYGKVIIHQKYEFIEKVIKEILFHKDQKVEKTDRIDRFLTHPILGLPIFLCIMAVVFLLTFSVGDAIKVLFDLGVTELSNVTRNLLNSVGASAWVISLLVDGIIAGVGGILTFIPNICILFLALALLEDSGYMARVAYVMDHLMGKVGLSGKAFLPMILGFGCTVPAIMATRALETEKDRRKTMIITPFMSCSARLPIYVLFSQMFFGKYAVLVAFSMYLVGMLFGILIAFILNKIDKGTLQDSLLIELPEYKSPNARSVGIYVWMKVKDYITKAGTTIFIASILIWVILNMNPGGLTTSPEDSFGAMLGEILVPILAPAGLGMWQIGVALIAGISAKEVVVSSFAVLFGVTSTTTAAGISAMTTNIQSQFPGFGPLNAISLMLFCLLYVPCVATIATIKKESNSWRFTLSIVIAQILLAWVVSVVFFQIGSFLF